jgi:hypothetical protein
MRHRLRKIRGMIKRMVFSTALAVAMSGAAMAATIGGVTVSHDGRTVVQTKPQPHYLPALQHKKGLKTIFSNIGTDYPKGLYFCCYGSTISGPNSELAATYWAAAAFTPTADATVTEIDAGVGYVAGTNSVTLSLYTDTGGVPGTLIKSFTSGALGDFGSCCTLAVASDKKGIAVTAGTQYWLTVTTSKAEDSTFAAWSFNSTDQTVPVNEAYNDGSGWTSYSGAPAVSFGIYGK